MTQPPASPEAGAQEKKASKRGRSTRKRQVQNLKRRGENRAFLSEVHTAIRHCREEKDAAKRQKLLAQVASFMDKGVKKSVFKKNKADRMKSRLAKMAV